jgi:glycosyltransferase involved in cell wall biosynthesis
MHAWSLGACIVAHSDAALSLPEMVDGENALLGGDPDAIVERIARALGDRSLRRRIGAAGRAMFLAHFTGAAVAADLMQRMRRALAASDAATSRESQLSVQPEGARL